MRKLTDNQKTFLLEYFFINDRYAGWRNIATTLLEEGSCIVAGEESIWIGGIGNFIVTEKSPKFFGCLLYTFDLEIFLYSEWYLGIRKEYISRLKEELKKAEDRYKDVVELAPL